MRNRLLLASVIVLLLGFSALVWVGIDRLNTLEKHLTEAEMRGEKLDRALARTSEELKLAAEGQRAALEKAEKLGEQAQQSEEARREAESLASHARTEEEAARQAAEQAKQRQLQAQADLDQLRKRREQELDRMVKALNQVAITRRTPSGMVMELADDSFHFEFDDASLTPENREILSRIAGVLLASEGYRLFVYGHTDDVGTEGYNVGLSERRARSVREYLIKAGVPAEIIDAKGFGKSNPAVKGTSREARAKNRRVEIGVVDTIINYEGLAKGPGM